MIRYAKPDCSRKLVDRKHLYERRAARASRRYFTLKGTDAMCFSHSICSSPALPPVLESVILNTSTGDDGTLIVIFTRPKSMCSL